jgi:hypothetical protein
MELTFGESKLIKSAVWFKIMLRSKGLKMPDKPMTLGDLRHQTKDMPDDIPIDFGCQCDSFDIWDLHLQLRNAYEPDAILGFYLIRGKNAKDLQ